MPRFGEYLNNRNALKNSEINHLPNKSSARENITF